MLSNSDTSPTRRIAIYCRVSTDGQEDNTSLETQETACRNYARQHGYSIVTVKQDVFSGYALYERPGLTVLRELARQGTIDGILTYALDRLSRKQTHVAILDEECEQLGVSLLFVTESFENNAVGRFVRSVKGFAAELEREKIMERTIRGKRARAQSGRLTPGPRPLYGYRFTDAARSAYEHDPDTAPIVQQIFTLALDGVPLRAIGAGLQAHGVLSPSGASVWYPTTVRNIVNNPAYTGKATAFKWRTEKVSGKPSRTKTARAEGDCITLPDGVVPPLVDQATFDGVRERLRRNQAAAARNIHDPEVALLRAGIAVCGICGRNMRVAHRASRGTKLPLYVCNSNAKADARQCPGGAITVQALDTAVWDHVSGILQHPDLVRKHADGARLEDTTTSDLATVDRTIANVEKQRSNLTRKLAFFEDDSAAAPLIAEITRLGKEQQELVGEREILLTRQQRQHDALATLDRLEDWCRTVGENLLTLTYAEKRLAMEELGVRVRVWGQKHQGEAGERWLIDVDPAFAYTTSI